MVQASEDALTKERAKATTKKTNDYRALNDQVYEIFSKKLNKKFLFKIESLKISERQLKSKVRSLTNEIALLKRRLIKFIIKKNKLFLSYSTLHHPTTLRSSSRERSLQLNGYLINTSKKMNLIKFPLVILLVHHNNVHHHYLVHHQMINVDIVLIIYYQPLHHVIVQNIVQIQMILVEVVKVKHVIIHQVLLNDHHHQLVKFYFIVFLGSFIGNLIRFSWSI